MEDNIKLLCQHIEYYVNRIEKLQESINFNYKLHLLINFEAINNNIKYKKQKNKKFNSHRKRLDYTIAKIEKIQYYLKNEIYKIKEQINVLNKNNE